MSRRPSRAVEFARIAGVSFRWRPAVPSAILLPALALGFAPIPVLVCAVGVVVLVAIHELGHLVAAWAMGYRVLSVEVTPAGGECHLARRPREFGAALLIGAGGLLAQSGLLVLGLIAYQRYGQLDSEWLRGVWMVVLVMNALDIIANATPRYDRRRRLSTDGAYLRRLIVRTRPRGTRPTRRRSAS